MKFTPQAIQSVISKNGYEIDPNRVTEIPGGMTKQTFLVYCENRPCIFQIWSEPAIFQGLIPHEEYKWLYPTGLSNHLKAYDILQSINVCTPKIYFTDSIKSIIPYDCILLQHIEFDSHQGINRHLETGSIDQIFTGISDALGKLKTFSRKTAGALSQPAYAQDPIDIVTSLLDKNIDECNGIPGIAQISTRLRTYISDKSSNIPRRDNYLLVHGDFKPDNFRFDTTGNMYWIDIESLQFSDIEYEISLFQIPTFLLTNSDEFMARYFENHKTEYSNNRLTLYKLYRCINQILTLSPEKIGASGREMYASIVASNMAYIHKILSL